MILRKVSTNMSELDKDKVLAIYPEYNKVHGPYVSSTDQRKRVILVNNQTGEKTTRQLAKVVLEAKIGRRLVGSETVDHEDKDKTNDNPNNLRVLSRQENASIASKGNSYSLGYKFKEEQKSYGEKNPRAVLSNEKVKEFRESFAQNNITRKDIIETSGLTERAVRNFLNGTSYPQAGGPISSFKRGKN